MFLVKEGTAPDKIGEGTDDATRNNIVSWLEKGGHVIRTTKQDTDYLEAQVQPRVDKVLGERNTQIEQTVLKITGLPKNQGEKFYEYMERAVNDKLKAVSELESKIKEFESKGLEGSTLAQQYKKELENTQKQIQTLNQEWEGKLTEKEQRYFNTGIVNELDKLVGDMRLKFRQDVDPAILEDSIAGKLAKFHSENKAKSLDGHVIWTDTNGVTRNSKSDGKPLSTKEVLAPYFENLIDKNKGKGGSGSGEGGNGGQGGGAGGDQKWKDITLPPEIKTRVALMEYLTSEKKLSQDTKEFAEAFDNLGKNMPLR